MFAVRDDDLFVMTIPSGAIANQGLRLMRAYRNLLCLSLLSINLCGCANLWHELQPHRMRRINRVPPPSWDPEFSQTSSSPALSLVRSDRSVTPSRLTVNRADVIVVRGQTAR